MAYAEGRKELDKIFGASCDSVVLLIRQLTCGTAIPETDHAAHLELYTRLICAEAMAIALGQRDLLDRFNNCNEIIEKKLPFLAPRWYRDNEKSCSETQKCFGFRELNRWVSDAIRILARQQNLAASGVNATNTGPTSPVPSNSNNSINNLNNRNSSGPERSLGQICLLR